MAQSNNHLLPPTLALNSHRWLLEELNLKYSCIFFPRVIHKAGEKSGNTLGKRRV
jgi:hypothetical protein